MIPTERQMLFFSATMSGEVTKLSANMLRDPARVSVTPQATTAERVDQRVILTERASKAALLIELLKAEPIDRVLVFTRTRHGADKVVRLLHKAGLAADAIHGNKSQNQRERALSAFRDGRIRTLIATDIAARGIDVDGVSHVVNYDLPNVPESYVHRIGRTARAGREGIAISFCDHDEAPFLRDIEQLIRMSIPATDRRSGKRPAHGAAAQHADYRHRGRGHSRSSHKIDKPHRGNGRHAPRTLQPAHGRVKPSGLGNVRFMERPQEPRRHAGQRTQAN
jgi:ATP-dependent RNA helicase RhlE